MLKLKLVCVINLLCCTAIFVSTKSLNSNICKDEGDLKTLDVNQNEYSENLNDDPTIEKENTDFINGIIKDNKQFTCPTMGLCQANCLNNLSIPSTVQNEGVQGKRGPRGPPGDRGSPGPPASFNPEEFMGNKGPPGYPGLSQTGAKGEMGFKGETGDKGITGDVDKVGKLGLTGLPGLDGRAGPKGIPGDKGSTGRNLGERGLPGLAGPKGPKGDRSDSSKQYIAFIPALHGNALSQRQEEIKVLLKPIRNGTKLFPGRTCDDFEENLDFPGGTYWIDPNGGNPNDAFEVYCNKNTAETCISAIQNETSIITVPSLTDGNQTDPKQYIWLSEMIQGTKIKYKASTSQIKYLQNLLPIAVQSIEFHCRISDGYFKDYGNMSLQFLGWNDAVLTAKGSSRSLQYKIIADTCTKPREGTEWGMINMVYDTYNSKKLPITDIALRNFEENKPFYIKINPVCFRKYNTS